MRKEFFRICFDIEDDLDVFVVAEDMTTALEIAADETKGKEVIEVEHMHEKCLVQ